MKAAFTSNASSGCAALPVSFTDNSTGQPSSWFWSFGNGDTAVVQNPAYTYTIPGSYTVKLKVKKGTAADSITSIITVYDTANTAFGYSYNDICTAPALINFTVTTPQSNALYSWSFGDGTKSLNATTSHTYTGNSYYTVMLTATTDKGCKHTAAKEIQVGKGDAAFSAPAFACGGQPAVFTNTSIPLPRSSVWTIDGNTTVSGQDLTYTFTTTGIHTIQLAADFGTCKDVLQKSIPVNTTPKADFTANGTLQSCVYPQTVTFSNQSAGANSYNWIFDDGEAANTTSPTHTYKNAGSFSVSLIAYNANGCSDTLRKDALVQLGPPVIRGLAGLPTSGCIPKTVDFKADIVSGDPVASYDWDFGDGSPHSNAISPSYTYTKEGYYRVILNIKTVSGCTGSYNLFQAIAAGTPPANVDFTADKTNICASDSVQFKGTSTGSVTSWTWDFGDGTKTSGHDTARHQYQPGDYTVTYYLSNKGCNANVVQKKSYIHVRPPVSRFSPVYYCDDRLKVKFTDQSVNPQTWTWDFGDGQKAISQNPTITYNTSGQYIVALTTTNSGCSFTVKDTITVVGYKPAFAYTPGNAIICKGTGLTATINDPSFINSYTWYMGDGAKLYSDTSVDYTYNKSGSYSPWLAVQYLNGCTDTIYNAKPVTVYGASAAFNNNQSKTCIYTATVFTDNSSTDGIHPIKTWLWEYGDGKSDLYTAAPFKHVYETSSTFNVKLTTTDGYGCTDTAINAILVQQGGAKADFNYNTAKGCDSVAINFSDASVAYNDVVQSYKWNFGDNSNATQKNPDHYYTQEGTKKATLIITTAAGCTDTATKDIDVIIPESPSVAISGPNTSCASDTIRFNASTENNQPVAYWQWNFGNGDNTDTQNASYTYTAAKTYTVTLIATGSNQCADTIFHTITINPLPFVNAGSDTVICAGNSIMLTASGAESYAWQPAAGLSCTNCVAPVVQPIASSTYYVQGISSAGCAAEDSLNVQVINKSLLTLTNSAPKICAGNTVQLSAAGAYSYSWMPVAGLSNAAIANPVANPAQTVTYTVTGTDSLHCFEDTKQVIVTVAPAPVFDIIDTLFVAGLNGNTVLKTTSSPDIVKWQWTPALGLSCYDCAQPQVQATNPVVYTANASNSQGCSVSDKVRVEILCNQSNIFIPSAFTPNGDGRNDRFYPLSSIATKVPSFVIYNKTGELIYSKKDILTNDYRQGWDGMYKGFMLGTGIYIYRIEVWCDNKIISFTGTVTLVR